MRTGDPQSAGILPWGSTTANKLKTTVARDRNFHMIFCKNQKLLAFVTRALVVCYSGF